MKKKAMQTVAISSPAHLLL